MMAPGIPRHNYFPFSPRAEKDQGVVPGAKLIVRYQDGVWRYRAAIPWSELSLVKPLAQAGKPVAFTFLCKNRGGTALDWNRERSVSRRENRLPFRRELERLIQSGWAKAAAGVPVWLKGVMVHGADTRNLAARVQAALGISREHRGHMKLELDRDAAGLRAAARRTSRRAIASHFRAWPEGSTPAGAVECRR